MPSSSIPSSYIAIYICNLLMVFIVDKKIKTMNASTLLPNYPTCVIDSESNRAVVVYGLSLTAVPGWYAHLSLHTSHC